MARISENEMKQRALASEELFQSLERMAVASEEAAANRYYANLFKTLDSLHPMPISRTTDRMMQWLSEAQMMGLITQSETTELRFSLKLA